jgi:hypothetical protein
VQGAFQAKAQNSGKGKDKRINKKKNNKKTENDRNNEESYLPCSY